MSKIPTLVLDDGAALYDSPVFCEYLDALDGKPQLFPRDRRLRMVALRRQALGDGFLDLLVLARNERLRKEPSEVQLNSAAVRSGAVLESGRSIRLLFRRSRRLRASRRFLEFLLGSILFWWRIHKSIKTIKTLILFL